MDDSRSGTLTTISLPFRIMPSRGQNLFPAMLFMIVGAAVAIGGLSFGDGGAAKIGIAAVGSFGAIFGVFMFRRERRFFDPRASYWMVVTQQGIAMVTPDDVENFAWADLASFVVTRSVSESRDSDGRTSESVSYSLDARNNGNGADKLKVPLNDFATRFSGNEQERAEAMCSALNELRQRFIGTGASGADEQCLVPRGLVVKPMSLAALPSKPDNAPTVQR